MPMHEIQNRVYLDANNKVTTEENAVTSIAPGRITEAEAALYGLTAAAPAAVAHEVAPVDEKPSKRTRKS